MLAACSTPAAPLLGVLVICVDIIGMRLMLRSRVFLALLCAICIGLKQSCLCGCCNPCHLCVRCIDAPPYNEMLW
jgi:hypothetical protein